MIKRENYLAQIRPFYDSDLIKIITGIRRCGKSVVMKQIIEELSLKTDNIVYIEFENLRIRNLINTATDLLNYIDKQKKPGNCYIFLDEIQVLDDWAEACKTLRLESNSVFITGSNSKLLSGEFTKQLSGRYVSFRIRPFVYKEALEYSKELGKEFPLSDYLVNGGFPKRFELDKDSQEVYFNDLNNTIIYNDLISRYPIKKPELFKKITDFILLSNSRIISATSINKYLKSRNENCSINTVLKYITYLEEAFVIDRIAPYSTRAKRALDYTYKIYDSDVSLTSIRSAGSFFDLTYNLENIVYNELLFMGYKLSVFNDSDDNGIDFLAQKGNLKYYIQVSYSVHDEKTYQREMRPFAKLDNSSQKILITTDEIDYSTSTVKHICLKDFLLMKGL